MSPGQRRARTGARRRRGPARRPSGGTGASRRSGRARTPGRPSPAPRRSPSAGSSSSSAEVLWNGSGSSGSIARSPSTTGGTVGERVALGAELAQRPQQRRALGVAAEEGGHHDRERAPAGERRHVGDRREVQQRGPRHELVGERWAAARSRCAAPRPRARTGRTARPRRGRRPRTTSNSIAVTTPKLPPPPRSAQNRSGSCSASTRTSSPSAVTSSSAVTALVCSPYLRASQPMPPPSE